MFPHCNTLSGGIQAYSTPGRGWGGVGAVGWVRGTQWEKLAQMEPQTHLMSAALFKRAPGIHGAFGRHEHSLFQSAISLMEQNLKSLQTNTAMKRNDKGTGF